MPRQILTKRDLEDIQQPLAKDGYTNDWFNKLYGKDKNPSTGTERDRRNKRSGKLISIPAEDWERIFGKNEINKGKIQAVSNRQLGR